MHRLRHGGAIVRVVLNLEVERAFQYERRHAPDWVVVLESAGHIRDWQARECGGDERLHIRPEDVEARLGGVVVARLITVALENLLDAGLPLFELALVGRDGVEPALEFCSDAFGFCFVHQYETSTTASKSAVPLGNR